MNNQLYTEFYEKVAKPYHKYKIYLKVPYDNHVLNLITNKVNADVITCDEDLIYSVEFVELIHDKGTESELIYQLYLGVVGSNLVDTALRTDEYQSFLSKLKDDYTIEFIEDSMKKLIEGIDVVKSNIENYDYSFITDDMEKLTKIVTDYITKRDNTYKEHEQLLDTLDGAGLFLLNKQVFSNDDLEDDVNLLGMECELLNSDFEYNTYSILPSVNSMAYPYFDLREGTFDKNKFDLELTGGYISDDEIEDGYNSYENYLEYIEYLDQVVNINNSLKDLIENYNNLREKFNLKVR